MINILKGPIKPFKNVQKLLISSSSRLLGEFESEHMNISLAFPQIQDKAKLKIGLDENPYSRNYFVVTVRTAPIQKGTKYLPNDYYLGEEYCIYLSIFFGKRFDNHGVLESLGIYFVPNFINFSPVSFTDIGFNNHYPRIDLNINLNLKEFENIFNIINSDHDKKEFLLSAGKYYVRALRIFEDEPEMAYLDLITCGEILSNYYDFSEDDLYDDELKKIFEKISKKFCEEDKLIKKIKNRLYQVRKKYSLTLFNLLNKYFYSNTESKDDNYRIRKNSIEKNLKASYDLRSKYVHTGNKFGSLTNPWNNLNNEIVKLPKDYQINDREYYKIIKNSLTFTGLERITRYSLLRFIHLNISKIDNKLD